MRGRGRGGRGRGGARGGSSASGNEISGVGSNAAPKTSTAPQPPLKPPPEVWLVSFVFFFLYNSFINQLCYNINKKYEDIPDVPELTQQDVYEAKMSALLLQNYQTSLFYLKDPKIGLISPSHSSSPSLFLFLFLFVLAISFQTKTENKTNRGKKRVKHIIGIPPTLHLFPPLSRRTS